MPSAMRSLSSIFLGLAVLSAVADETNVLNRGWGVIAWSSATNGVRVGLQVTRLGGNHKTIAAPVSVYLENRIFGEFSG